MNGSLTLTKDHKLGVFENRVLRGMCGPKVKEVTRGCRKLHNEELHNLYYLPDTIRMIKSSQVGWSGHVAHTGIERDCYKVFLGKPDGNRGLGARRWRWEDNIKMDLREIEWGGMYWIHLAQDRDQWLAPVNMERDLQIP
jgi:hypothetical protein